MAIRKSAGNNIGKIIAVLILGGMGLRLFVKAWKNERIIEKREEGLDEIHNECADKHTQAFAQNKQHTSLNFVNIKGLEHGKYHHSCHCNIE